jgi:AcrR family transcriptional regulator
VTEGAESWQPSKPLPTSPRGQRTRDALVEAGRRVFVEHGYGEATAALITAAAGVSYGTFYVYFSSKEDLFAQIARQLIDDVYEQTRAPRGLVDYAERLEYENRRYFELYRENSALFQLVEEVIRTDPGFRELWRGMRTQHLSRVAKSIRRLQKEGRVDATLHPECAAGVLGGMAERAAYVATIDDRFDDELLNRTLSALWTNALNLRG